MAIRVIIEEDEKFAGDFDLPGLSKGGFLSLFLHASVFFLVIMVTHQKKKAEVMLTEITLVDQIIPVPEEEEPPPLPMAPPEQKNVWDFLKQAIPIKQKPDLAADLPMDLPKKDTQPEMAPMPDALKLGSKKDLDKPMMDKPLDLVGRKAVNAPAGMNVDALQMNKRKDSLAQTSQLPSGISLGKKSSFLPQQQVAVVNTQQFARRANLQARGGSLADMPTIKKPEAKKKVEFDTSNLNLQREQNTFQIFGPLKDRPIIEKYLPRYPRWAEEQGIECSVSLHFFVLPEGQVKENLFVEQSSGYSEMDGLAMKALRAFKFAPLGAGKRQEEQEGVIIFYFRLSR
ncbi:energy transducer TonB [candidate division FCPU426 bacterium]|nr:energy transducer TonB [candidate division FCPU426 bacterium]